MKPKNIKALQSESRDLQVKIVNHRTLVVESSDGHLSECFLPG